MTSTSPVRGLPWNRRWRPPPPGLQSALTLWVLMVAGGTVFGLNYQLTPAEKGEVSDSWPLDCSLAPAADRPTLVVFLHPRCPCSRATLNELLQIVSRCGDRAALHVHFLRPESKPAGWERSDLWSSAERVPGAVLNVDNRGVEHLRFGARVSGEVLLYRADGRLQFHGGITGGRGHVGANAGRAAIEAFLMHGELPIERFPVFGCALETPDCAPQSCCPPTEAGAGR